MKSFFRLLVFSIPLLLSSGYSAENENLTKQEKWENMSLEVDSWCDGLGYPIDPNIKEVVVALNVLGIPTRQSCEGHLDRACPYPWVDVDISTPEIEKLEHERKLLNRRRLHQEELIDNMFPELSPYEQWNTFEGELLADMFKALILLCDEIEKLQANQLKNIYFLLEQFYKTESCSYDCTLIVEIRDLGRINSIGADMQCVRSEEEREIKLLEYQKEMDRFAHFLKNLFFQSEYVQTEYITSYF